jgi:hypothetical protein
MTLSCRMIARTQAGHDLIPRVGSLVLSVLGDHDPHHISRHDAISYTFIFQFITFNYLIPVSLYDSLSRAQSHQTDHFIAATPCRIELALMDIVSHYHIFPERNSSLLDMHHRISNHSNLCFVTSSRRNDHLLYHHTTHLEAFDASITYLPSRSKPNHPHFTPERLKRPSNLNVSIALD